MLDNGFINAAQFKESATSEVASAHEPPIEIEAPYVAGTRTSDALARLGNSALTDGYTIHTTIDSTEQGADNEALRDGLVAYDQRHGYRGAEAHVELPTNVNNAELDKPDGFHAVVGLALHRDGKRREVGTGLYRDGSISPALPD